MGVIFTEQLGKEHRTFEVWDRDEQTYLMGLIKHAGTAYSYCPIENDDLTFEDLSQITDMIKALNNEDGSISVKDNSLTGRMLSHQLDCCKNLDAVVVLCVDDWEYACIVKVIDESRSNTGDFEIGNILLRIDSNSSIAKRLVEPL